MEKKKYDEWDYLNGLLRLFYKSRLVAEIEIFDLIEDMGYIEVEK